MVNSIRNLDRLILFTLLVAMLWLSRDFGITFDEGAQQTYGTMVVSFFESGFKNRESFTFLNLYLYGGFFDALAVCVQRGFPIDIYDARHFLNAFIAWIGYVYAWKLGRALGGAATGWWALLLLLMSPMYFGHMANNPKDMPFASSYLASLYYIVIFTRELPTFRPKTLAKLITAIGLAINMRVGGILLICFWEMTLGLWILHDWRQQKRLIWRRIMPIVAAAVLSPWAALAFGTLGWPWAQWQPFLRPFQALTEMSHFNWLGILLFNGTKVSAGSLPWSYAPLWFAVTTPLLVLLGILLALVFSRNGRWWELLFLTLAAVFPVFYVIIKHSVLYNGVRQLLFAYPPLVVVSAYGLHQTWCVAVKDSRWSWTGIAVLAGFAACAFDPIAFSIRYHPNESNYFNSFVGGTRGAYGKFDLDYWGNCQKEAIHWIAAIARREQRTIKVSYDTPGHKYIELEVGQPGIISFVDIKSDPDYLTYVISPEDWDIEKMKSNKDIVYTVQADGAPLCAVLKGPTHL